MDRVRVFEVSQGLNVVQAELFPDISIGDAPATPQATGGTASPATVSPAAAATPAAAAPIHAALASGNGAHP